MGHQKGRWRGGRGAEPLDGPFTALGDATRRAMLARLLEGEASLTSLATPVGLTLAGALKHVRVLERAGLAATRKDGRTRMVLLRADGLARALEFLEAYRLAASPLPRFDATADYIDLSDMDVT